VTRRADGMTTLELARVDPSIQTYSYEGTREINTLIVGRVITGESAFV